MKPMIANPALIALGLTGCSWLGVTPRANDWTPSQEPRCTASFQAPAIDVVAGGSLVFTGLAIQASIDREPGGPNPRELVGAMILLPAAVYLAAALGGFQKVRRCRAAHQRRDAWKRTMSAEEVRVIEQRAAEASAADEARRQPNRRKPEQECRGLLASWRAEPDVIRRTVLFDALPADCRNLVTTPSRTSPTR